MRLSNGKVTHDDLRRMEKELDEMYIKQATATNHYNKVCYSLACEDLRRGIEIIKTKLYGTKKFDW